MLDDLQATFSLSKVFTGCLKSERQGLCTCADLSDLTVCFPNLHTDTDGQASLSTESTSKMKWVVQNSHKCSRLIVCLDEVRASAAVRTFAVSKIRRLQHAPKPTSCDMTPEADLQLEQALIVAVRDEDDANWVGYRLTRLR